MRASIKALTAWTLLAYGVTNAHAHEVRPAFLQLEEIAPSTFAAVWKQPILGERRLAIEPVLPDDCTRAQSRPPTVSNGALLEHWRISCDLRTGVLAIAGLERTLTDVLVQVSYLDGRRINTLLRAAQPSVQLEDPTPSLPGYLALGVEHLLLGIDHILFVVGLVLFIPDRWMLVKTITAFTAAHSLTLALSVLELVTLPQGPVEAVIALSILFLARELIVAEPRRSVITRLRPWLMAFVFGLLHGFGFAGALADIGLPRDQLALALLLFNIGIEIGQLLVIGLILSLAGLARAVWPSISRGAVLTTRNFAAVMGVAAAFWTIDRVTLIF